MFRTFVSASGPREDENASAGVGHPSLPVSEEREREREEGGGGREGGKEEERGKGRMLGEFLETGRCTSTQQGWFKRLVPIKKNVRQSNPVQC